MFHFPSACIESYLYRVIIETSETAAYRSAKPHTPETGKEAFARRSLNDLSNRLVGAEIEGVLAIQMACTHAVAIAVLSRAGGAYGGDRHIAMMAAAATKLLRAYAVQVETLRRLRSGGSQHMRIEHIHIESAAQAVIANVGYPNDWKRGQT